MMRRRAARRPDTLIRKYSRGDATMKYLFVIIIIIRGGRRSIFFCSDVHERFFFVGREDDALEQRGGGRTLKADTFAYGINFFFFG